jgi:hypothetical protein
LTPNLPTDELPDEDPVLVLKTILDASPYSVTSGGNVVVRSGWDVDEEIPAPAWILTAGPEVSSRDWPEAVLDEIDVTVTIDAFAKSEAEIRQLMVEADRLLREARTTPGGVYSLVFDDAWINNDALNQAEGYLRRTKTTTLIKFRGVR